MHARPTRDTALGVSLQEEYEESARHSTDWSFPPGGVGGGRRSACLFLSSFLTVLFLHDVLTYTRIFLFLTFLLHGIHSYTYYSIPYVTGFRVHIDMVPRRSVAARLMT